MYCYDDGEHYLPARSFHFLPFNAISCAVSTREEEKNWKQEKLWKIQLIFVWQKLLKENRNPAVDNAKNG